MDVDDGKATIHKDSTEDFVQEIEESELTVDVRP
jgi:hypothetical protein